MDSSPRFEGQVGVQKGLARRTGRDISLSPAVHSRVGMRPTWKPIPRFDVSYRARTVVSRKRRTIVLVHQTIRRPTARELGLLRGRQSLGRGTRLQQHGLHTILYVPCRGPASQAHAGLSAAARTDPTSRGRAASTAVGTGHTAGTATCQKSTIGKATASAVRSNAAASSGGGADNARVGEQRAAQRMGDGQARLAEATAAHREQAYQIHLQQEKLDKARRASDPAAQLRDEEERRLQKATMAEARAVATAERHQKATDAAAAQTRQVDADRARKAEADRQAAEAAATARREAEATYRARQEEAAALARAQIAQIEMAKTAARKATADEKARTDAAEVEATRQRRCILEQQRQEQSDRDVAAALARSNERYRLEMEREEAAARERQAEQDQIAALAVERQQILDRDRRLNERDRETHDEAVRLHAFRRQNANLDLQPAPEPPMVQPQQVRQPLAQIQPQAQQAAVGNAAPGSQLPTAQTQPQLQPQAPAPSLQPPPLRKWGRGSSNDHLCEMPLPFTNHQQQLPIWPVVSYPACNPSTGYRPNLAVASTDVPPDTNVTALQVCQVCLDDDPARICPAFRPLHNQGVDYSRTTHVRNQCSNIACRKRLCGIHIHPNDRDANDCRLKFSLECSAYRAHCTACGQLGIDTYSHIIRKPMVKGRIDTENSRYGPADHPSDVSTSYVNATVRL